MKTLKISIIFLLSLVAVSAFAQKNKKVKHAPKEEKVTVKEEKPAAKIDSTTILQEFAGEYSVTGTSDFSAVTVTFDTGKLMGKADVQPDFYEMKPLATADKFGISSPDTYAEITFVRDDKKKVTGMKIAYGGQEVIGTKVK